MSRDSWEFMEICLMVEFIVFPLKGKWIYMNIHNYVTKLQLSK
jgi:hypothetical protein